MLKYENEDKPIKFHDIQTADISGNRYSVKKTYKKSVSRSRKICFGTSPVKNCNFMANLGFRKCQIFGISSCQFLPILILV